jgi:transposase
MPSIEPISRQQARALVRWAKKSKDACLLIRAQMVEIFLWRCQDARSVAQELQCAVSGVYRWVRRFAQDDRVGLLDRRTDNGTLKATPSFQQVVNEVLWGSPLDHGYSRPTWTRELLVLVAESLTGVRVSVCVMGRVLRNLRARRGNPKPVVRCPLSKRQQRRRLARIRRLIADLPGNEVVVYEDEVDIHLNPKIGLDWMHRGHQREVVTPGKNQKAYIAGALDARDGTLVWTGADQKNSLLFVQLLSELAKHYADAKRIHVILDNYGIHSSHETRRAIRQLQRIQLHFLPSYSPDHNRIERLWQDLHANVTRNHRHKRMEDLCAAVAAYLDAASPWCPASRQRSRRYVRFMPRRQVHARIARPKNQRYPRSAVRDSRSVI